MTEKYYQFSFARTEFRYEFLSISDEKQVKKVVIFAETTIENIHNLILLDVLDNGELSSDLEETKNKDYRTVMATVMQIINDFLNKNSNFYVTIGGSDERRKRLYQLIISRELSNLLPFFEIYGNKNNEYYLFESNQKYDFYLITKK